MTIFFIVLLGVGIVVGLHLRRQSQAAGTGIVVACSVIGVLAAIGRLVTDANAPANYEVVRDEIQITQRAMAEELGRYLAEQSAGTKALCLLNPSEENNPAIENGLTRGLGDGISVTFALVDRQDDPGQVMDTVEVSATLVRANLNRNPGTDLIICMADLPMDARGLASLLKREAVHLAAGNVFDPTMLALYARAGVFAGAAVYRDNVTAIDDLKRATSREIFDSLYVLLPAPR